MTSHALYTTLNESIQHLEEEVGLIPSERIAHLHTLAGYITDRLREEKPVHLVFICTHNSRRSHISQIWAATAAAWYGIHDVHCYSGGTEATAFNPRAVAAIERAGFYITHPGGDNPVYEVRYADNAPAIRCFSKVYDDPANPQTDFAAVMTCSDADANCPYIPGATRISLTYEDPKVADNTPAETERYDERVRQIGRELFYAFSCVE